MEFLLMEFVVETLPTDYGFAPVLESLQSSFAENLQVTKVFSCDRRSHFNRS